MIGPSSITESASKAEPDRSPSGSKRKAFDDLDIDDFCNEVYPDNKKQYLPEFSIPIEELSSQIIQNSELTSSDMGSMTKLEVLVVDGMWDDSNFDNAELTELSSGSDRKETDENEVVQEQSLNTNLEQDLFWHSTVTGEEIKNNTSKVIKKVNNFTPLCNPIEDQENGNLSWLLDFKLDSFIDAPDDKCKTSIKNKNKLNRSNVSLSNIKKLTTNDNKISNQSTSMSRINSQKKPPFTYTELIEHALQEKGELTVSAIYQWISDHFPYYKSNDDRWKNSVRHNLSINPHFRKGSKAPHGAGHLWAIANQDESKNRNFLNGTNVISTTRQILKSLSNIETIKETVEGQSQLTPIDEVAAATASIVQKSDEEEEIPTEIIGSFTLEHSAERILSGMKQDVEVQYLIPMMISDNDENRQSINSNQQCSIKETDFLNPVSKEVVAEECGLIEEGYLVTDLNPAVLGLNLTEQEIVSPENLFGEELSFQFYELTSPSQLQSA